MIENSQKQKFIQQILSNVFGEEVYNLCGEFRDFGLSTQAFSFLINYIREHNPDLVRKISLPEFTQLSIRMILANHTPPPPPRLISSLIQNIERPTPPEPIQTDIYINESDIYSSSCRESRSCILSPSNKGKPVQPISLRPPPVRTHNAVNSSRIPANRPIRPPQQTLPPQPNVRPLDSTNRVKRKQNPKPVAPIKQNSIRAQLRLMKITRL